MKILNEHTADEHSSWNIKHSSQFMSLFIGGLLVFMGLWGAFFDGFLGVQHQVLYWLLVVTSGVVLGYFGYKDDKRASSITCALFGLVFLFLGLLHMFNLPITRGSTFMANYVHQGSIDYLTNLVIAFFLFGGAIDWWRRANHKPVTEKHINEKLLK